MNRKRPIHLDPQTAESGATTETVVTPENPFAGLVAEMQAEKTGTAAAEVKTEEPAKTEVKTEEKTEVKTEVKTEAKTEEKTETETDELEIPVLNEEAQEATWIDWGKEVGIDLKEDSYMAATAAIKEKLTSEYERGKKEASAPDPTLFPPDARDLVQALQGGTKLEEILNPVAQFNAAIALDDESIVRGVLQNQYKFKVGADGKLSEGDQKILDDEISVLSENDTLKSEARKYRALLETARDNKYNEIVSNGKKAWEKEQSRLKEVAEAENKSISEALRGRKEFMGAKLNDQHVVALMKKWESGFYKQQFNSPEKVVDFILYSEYGAGRYDKLKESISKEMKTDQFRKLSNTPATPAGGKTENKTGEAQSLGDAFKEMLQQGVNGVSV